MLRMGGAWRHVSERRGGARPGSTVNASEFGESDIGAAGSQAEATMRGRPEGIVDAMRPTRHTSTAPRNRREVVADALARLAPRLPAFEAEATLERALSSPGLRGAVPETAAWLALVAYGRHVFTEYESLLDEGYDRDSARHFVLDDLNAVLSQWGCRRVVSGESEAEEPDSAP